MTNDAIVEQDVARYHRCFYSHRDLPAEFTGTMESDEEFLAEVFRALSRIPGDAVKEELKKKVGAKLRSLRLEALASLVKQIPELRKKILDHCCPVNY